MTRMIAKQTVVELVRQFSADDVKDWLAEACTEAAGRAWRAGDPDASEWMAFANAVAAVRNLGV